MLQRIFFPFIFFIFSSAALAQTLTISSTGQTGTSGTTWNLTGSTLTVTGTANIQSVVIETALNSGDLTIQGSSTAFVVNVNQAISSTTVGSDLTIGSVGNTGTVTVSANISLASGLTVRGGYVNVNANITSSAAGDIFLKGIATNNPSVILQSGKTITKSGGTGTLTFQGHSSVQNSGTITTTGTGVLNVVLWSDFDNSNNDGGVSHFGTISTNGGHVWMGGSNSNGGSYTWNNLTVGDGPSIGSTNYNGNALNLFGNITTFGGDLLAWANTGPGYSGIVTDNGNEVNVGNGDIILITPYVVGIGPSLFFRQSGGTFTLVPNAGAFPSTLDWSPVLGVYNSMTGWNFPGNFNYLWIENPTLLKSLTIGYYDGMSSGGSPVPLTNSSHITMATAMTIAGPISIYGGDLVISENITSTLLGADVLLQGNGAISLAASKTIETTNGDITFRSNASGTAVPMSSSTIGAITLANASSLLSTGGNITLGGNFSGAQGAGLYAATNRVGGAPGILLTNATLTAAGGNINIYGKCVSSYDDGIRLYGNITTTGSGSIGLYGEAFGGFNSATFFGGITFVTAPSLVETDAGNLTLSGVLTSVQNMNTYGINFYRTTYTSGSQANHIQLLSKTGNIQIIGSPGTTAAGGIGHSSWGNIFFGSPATGYTATGSIKFTYSNLVHAGGFGFKVKTTGPVTYEPVGSSFSEAQILPPTTNYILAESASNLTIGKAGNTADITISSAQSIAGDIDIYAGTLTLNANLTTTNNGDITINSNNAIAGLTSQRNVTAAGLFSYIPQGISFGAAVTYPITNLNVTSAGLLIGKTTNTANVTFGTAATFAGPITAYGGTISVNANLTSTLNGAAILLQGSKVVQSGGTSVQTSAGNITYTAMNSPWTANAEQSILVGGVTGSTTTINAQGGNVSMSGTFTTTGVTNTSTNADVAVLLRNATVKTSGSGSISMNGNAYENASTSGDFIWGVMLSETNLIQTGSGNISITGTPGKIRPNGRGVVADGSSLKILSTSGTINITDAMPAGHILTNYSGAYFKPLSASSIRFGADGSLVTSSSSNVIFDVNYITFDVNPTILTSTGTLTIRPVATSFAFSFTPTNLTIPTTLSGYTIGKTGNTANIAMETATTMNGPITLHGGTLALNNALTTTNITTGNLSLNGTTLSGSSTLTVANGRTLTMNLSSNTDYTGLISGTSLNFVKDGAGTLTLPTPTALSFAAMTISAGAYTLNANQQLTLTGALTNNGTFTMKDGATFVQATSGTSIDGTGTYTVEKALASNSSTWSTTSGRFWYMGVPMVNVARSSYGTHGTTTNRVWSYTESSKSYTELINESTLLSAGTGYVHRRSTNDTLTFTATGANGLYGSDYSVSGLTKTAGYTSGVNLVSNPYMGFLDWDAVYNASTNIDPTFYIRSNNTTGNNINALISYNGSTSLAVSNESSVSNTSNFRYIAPMQSIWVKVGAAASTGTVNMSRSMLSHQTGNALKSSTVFPTLARVNLVDGNLFDQLLVYMNGDMTNEVDQYDSEKLPVSGTVQVYTMASNKKLVMNGLKNNKNKVSVPLYLELPETKSYTLQLSEYVLEDGLILLEDKQEGTMQDFTLLENYTFYANSGQLNNRFVLHFILPNAELTTQGPSNNWVGPETSYTDGGNVEITNDDRGNIEITVDQAEEQKVEGIVSVTDMNGKEVYKGQLDGITTAVSLNVPAGIYYLTVQSGALFEKKKVFIQE